MDFEFLNVESICGFTSTFVAIYSSTPHIFGFSSRRKRPPIDIINFLVTTLGNKYKKVEFIPVDKCGSLERSYEFIKTCHNMNTIVQTTGEDASSLNGKSEIPNKTIDNTTRALLLKPRHKK